MLRGKAYILCHNCKRALHSKEAYTPVRVLFMKYYRGEGRLTTAAKITFTCVCVRVCVCERESLCVCVSVCV